MFYLATQITLWLLIAAIFGFIIGWLLRGTRTSGAASGSSMATKADGQRIKQLENDLAAMEIERDELRAAVKQQKPSYKTASGDDDLKLIPGIGPVLERRLHELGIKTFKQIAAFDEKEAERVSLKITKFPDRINRENWMKSAQQILKEYAG